MPGDDLHDELRGAIDDARRLQDELQGERDFALSIMNNMGQGLTLVDTDSRFEYVNPAYARLAGRSHTLNRPASIKEGTRCQHRASRCPISCKGRQRRRSRITMR